jgi:hypothetical protein
MAKGTRAPSGRQPLNPGLPPVHNFEKVGETFTGRYQGTNSGFDKEVASLMFEDEKGEMVAIWATVTLIRAVPKMQRGKVYDLIYEGDVKTKGGYRVKDLKVYESNETFKPAPDRF